MFVGAVVREAKQPDPDPDPCLTPMDGMVSQKYPNDDFWSFLPAQIWDDS